MAELVATVLAAAAVFAVAYAVTLTPDNTTQENDR